MEARSDGTARRRRRDLDASRQKAHFTHESGRQSPPEERDAGPGGECRRVRLFAKRAGQGGKGAVLRCSFFNSGDFWNQVDVPHA